MTQCSIRACLELACLGGKQCYYDKESSRLRRQAQRARSDDQKAGFRAMITDLMDIGKKAYNTQQWALYNNMPPPPIKIKVKPKIKINVNVPSAPPILSESKKEVCDENIVSREQLQETEIDCGDGLRVIKRLKTTHVISEKHTIKSYPSFDALAQSKAEFNETFATDATYIDAALQQQEESTQKAVYIMRAANTAFVKIGFSGNLLQRLSQLQTGCPHVLHLEYINRTKKYREMEKWLHVYFAPVHITGEWFSIQREFDFDPVFQQFGNQEMRVVMAWIIIQL